MCNGRVLNSDSIKRTVLQAIAACTEKTYLTRVGVPPEPVQLSAVQSCWHWCHNSVVTPVSSLRSVLLTAVSTIILVHEGKSEISFCLANYQLFCCLFDEFTNTTYKRAHCLHHQWRKEVFRSMLHHAQYAFHCWHKCINSTSITLVNVVVSKKGNLLFFFELH